MGEEHRAGRAVVGIAGRERRVPAVGPAPFTTRGEQRQRRVDREGHADGAGADDARGASGERVHTNPNYTNSYKLRANAGRRLSAREPPAGAPAPVVRSARVWDPAAAA